MSKRWMGALAAVWLAPAAALAQESGAAAQGAPGTDEKADGVSLKLSSLEEGLGEAKATLEKLTRLKLSGYVQGRYQLNEATNLKAPATAPAPASANDGFSIRRGRLKAVYDTKVAEAVLQVDATGTGVVLKQAEATLKLPWIGGWVLVGQTEMPFGYETQASSADLALLERARVVRSFLPGEYDRMAKGYASWQFVNLKVGVSNGNTTEYKGYTVFTPGGAVNVAVAPAGLDNDQKKDVLGRLGVDLGWVSAGVSGWYGKTLANAALGTGTGNPPVALTNRYYERTRVGGDVQLYLDLLSIGGTSVKGEYIAGKAPYASGREQLGISANGWYVQLQQTLGSKLELAARFDRYDPRNGVDAIAGATGRYTPSTATNPARIDTIAYGAHWYFDPNLKLSAVHEIPLTEEPARNPANPLGGNHDPHDQLLTLQLQAKF